MDELAVHSLCWQIQPATYLYFFKMLISCVLTNDFSDYKS